MVIPVIREMAVSPSIVEVYFNLSVAQWVIAGATMLNPPDPSQITATHLKIWDP